MANQIQANSEIMKLLRQWGDGTESGDAYEILAIRKYDVETLRAALSSIFLSGNTQIRIYAIDAMPYILPREGIIQLLIPCLQDERVAIRWKSCQMLQRYPDRRATIPLMEVLRKEKNPDIRVVAADALGRIGNAEATTVLTDALKNDKGRDFEGRTVAKTARLAIAAIKERMKLV
jgi:HEAT repeat protein